MHLVDYMRGFHNGGIMQCVDIYVSLDSGHKTFSVSFSCSIGPFININLDSSAFHFYGSYTGYLNPFISRAFYLKYNSNNMFLIIIY
jgi:hypothetical protein